MTSDFSIAVHALVYLGKNQDLISSDELAKHIKKQIILLYLRSRNLSQMIISM